MAQFERVARSITIGNTLLGIPLLIAAGIQSHEHRPHWYDQDDIPILEGFIPLAFSVGTAIWYIRRAPKDTNAKLWILDFLTFGGYLFTLVVVWLRETTWLARSPQTLMLETYATVPLIVNIGATGRNGEGYSILRGQDYDEDATRASEEREEGEILDV
ncbi:hypothetical protein N0V90_012559 [Kalmusia sp. IMI 367209]|nr:hypothetical protein N0V90_012559 [Kalmusia sp. IMI 367209]